jgi:hypothetical protein
MSLERFARMQNAECRMQNAECRKNRETEAPGMWRAPDVEMSGHKHGAVASSGCCEKSTGCYEEPGILELGAWGLLPGAWIEELR